MAGSSYVSPRLEAAYMKAAEILERHLGEWSSVIEAYFLLRRFEKEIGFPLTYNMVEEVVSMVQERTARAAARATVAAEA